MRERRRPEFDARDPMHGIAVRDSTFVRERENNKTGCMPSGVRVGPCPESKPMLALGSGRYHRLEAVSRGVNPVDTIPTRADYPRPLSSRCLPAKVDFSANFDFDGYVAQPVRARHS